MAYKFAYVIFLLYLCTRKGFITMSRELKIQKFDDKQVRIVWDDEEQKYYFSVTDVVGVLTDQPDARGASTYWAVLKKRLKEEGANELITNCKQLKLPAAADSIVNGQLLIERDGKTFNAQGVQVR